MEEKKTIVELQDQLVVSAAPHVRSTDSVQRIMLDVIIAMVPAIVASVYFFKFRALFVIATAVVFAVLSEFICQRVMKRDVTISDLSAVVTGILLAFNVPVGIALWKVAFGSIFAIVIVKQLFGGIGSNFMNPALAARAVMMASWPTDMTTFVKPFTDATSQATPLSGGPNIELMKMFIGEMPGVLGEVSKVALLIGALYLLIRKVITWEIPVVYMASTAVFLVVLGIPVDKIPTQLFAGGLILGAFYMAPDYASSPVSFKARIIYAIGCGLLTAVIRVHGGYPEGVSYSILLMNVATPLIEKLVKPKVFGVGGAQHE